MRVVQMSTKAPAMLYSADTKNEVNTVRVMPQKNNVKNFRIDFKSFKTDDWILLGIILTLILEGSDDYILLCALGYLFIMGLV